MGDVEDTKGDIEDVLQRPTNPSAATHTSTSPSPTQQQQQMVGLLLPQLIAWRLVFELLKVMTRDISDRILLLELLGRLRGETEGDRERQREER